MLAQDTQIKRDAQWLRARTTMRSHPIPMTMSHHSHHMVCMCSPKSSTCTGCHGAGRGAAHVVSTTCMSTGKEHREGGRGRRRAQTHLHNNGMGRGQGNVITAGNIVICFPKAVKHQELLHRNVRELNH